ncbi:MAG: hypothetical protein H0T89_19225 [Deltaproteobacteria bacterium]|nr:hypothetical protein [Deltaproteobacteria bacterium]MDQ3296714.1 hypothetical protein [Myxococcota bacterium]
MRYPALLLVLAACQDKRPSKNSDSAPGPPMVRDAAAVTDAQSVATDWTAACAKALQAAARQTPVRRLGLVIAQCQPCGDWQPLLDWNTPAAEGGPTTAAIEKAMLGCQAYCSADAKQRFTGTLDGARGKAANKPWRILAETCGHAVSAVPGARFDARFASAPYFALDRIARATAAVPALAPLASALELPLPALSSTGAGFELPEAAVMKPDPGRYHITVSQGELHVGELPRARLGPAGVVVEHGAVPYPGARVTEKLLAAALNKLAPGDAAITLIAPAGMPAARVADAIVAGGGRSFVLAVAASGGPPGWTLPGIVPVSLLPRTKPTATLWHLDADADATISAIRAKPGLTGEQTIEVGRAATVGGLAKVLGALAYQGIATVTVQRIHVTTGPGR